MNALFPILFLIMPFLCVAQNKEGWLSAKFKNADSVLLVSHDDTQGVAVVDSAGNSVPLPALIVNKKPNYGIIRERLTLSGKQVDTIIRILERPFKSRRIGVTKCFMPHHAIFIFSNGKLSYIDLCFWCRRFDTSEDLHNIERFDNRKWQELEDFFKRLGFKYKLSSVD